MFRASLLGFLAVLGLSTSVALVGCRSDGGNNNNGNNDLTASGSTDLKGSTGDGGQKTDMPAFDTYTETTPHAIDVGDIQKFETVKLLGMVVTTPVIFFKSKGGTMCKYEMWVQDPTCSSESAAPCGIVIEDPTDYAMGSNGCAYPDKSNSILKDIKEGDNVDIFGVVDSFADSKPLSGKPAVVQHSVEVQKITKTSGTATVTAITLTTDADVARFVSKAGDGWAKFEGTIVKLAPSGKKLTITDVYDFDAKTGSLRAGLGATLDDTKDASLGDDFSFIYRPSTDAGKQDFPLKGNQFTSITGVVNTIFGGTFCPVYADDWVK